MGKDYIRLLDCTLRDGGFINDWQFGQETIINIFERAVSAKTDIIEVGFIDERREFDRDRTIMPDGASVNSIFSNLDHGSSMVVGMIDYGTCSVDKIPPCKESVMDGIRVIFKKKNRREAVAFCKELKDKGYRMFVQPVSITTYSDEEMIDMVNLVNELKPEAMSMVDTYGLLHEDGLLRYFDLIDEHLDKDIELGFHAHNNFQLAYANSIALIERNEKKDESDRRKLVIDGSSFGMGKGAGNAPIELVAMYLNERYEKDYDISQMLETIDVSVMKIYLNSPWGYSVKYYLASSNNCHPNYVQHLLQKRTLSVKSINEILDQISSQDKLTYNKEHIEDLYQKYQANEINDERQIEKLSASLKGHPILVLGPGKSIYSEKDVIQEYIAKNKPVVITINYLPDNYYSDYIFLSNAKRYVTLEGRLSRLRKDEQGVLPEIIATSNVTKINGSFDYTVDYSSLIDEEFEIQDSSLLMLLKLLIRTGVKKVSLAGFDGYTSSPGENYFNIAMEYAFVKEKADVLNKYTSDSLGIISKDIQIEFLTKTRYIF